MRLSNESGLLRGGVMAALWCAIAVVIVLYTVAERDRLNAVGQLGLHGQHTAATPFKQPYLEGAVDAQEWVQHAQSLLNGHSLRLRHTDIDNAPYGRDVHWNSAWAWTIALSGKVYHALTDAPIAESLERSTIWLTPTVLFALIIVVSAYASRRAGMVAGAAIAIAMVGHDRFYEGFLPTYVDHHGLLTASVFGLMLGAVFMGAGWWQETGELLPPSPALARNAAIVSAISGALGLWVSAASVVAPIAIVGIAGVATVMVCGRAAAKSGVKYDASVWRLWGRVGGAASVFFYLVEYFPSHLGLRLEANHPLYALAWWGGGELIAEIAERVFAPRETRFANPARVIVPVLMILAAPLTILVGGSKVFMLGDPYIGPFYKTYLTEFFPIWKMTGGLSANPWRSTIGITTLPLAVAIGLLIVRGRRVSPLIWFATLATIAFTAMAWWESRWMLNLSGPEICLTLALAAYFTLGKPAGQRAATVLGAFAVMFVPSALGRVVQARSERDARTIGLEESMFVLYRDMAASLRASQPAGDITLLADFNTSLSVGYYGQFKTIGTPYWENAAGLKAAAEILSAPAAEAKELIRERKITHIALVSADNFAAVYFMVSHPGGSDEEYKASLGYQLVTERKPPLWLQAVPFTWPEDLGPHSGDVLLYKVAFDQTAADALYHTALAEVARGDLDGAERDLDEVIRQTPKAHLPWLSKSGVLFAKRDWAGSADAAIKGIALAPAAQRTALYGWAAANLVRLEQHAQAIRVYHAGLADSFSADMACSLAFELSTPNDATVRNGAEAVALARRAVATKPDVPMYFNCLGAALAESGQYPEAVKTEERAVASAHALGDATTERVSAALLESFKAGKPWRE